MRIMVHRRCLSAVTNNCRQNVNSLCYSRLRCITYFSCRLVLVYLCLFQLIQFKYTYKYYSKSHYFSNNDKLLKHIYLITLVIILYSSQYILTENIKYIQNHSEQKFTSESYLLLSIFCVLIFVFPGKFTQFPDSSQLLYMSESIIFYFIHHFF